MAQQAGRPELVVEDVANARANSAPDIQLDHITKSFGATVAVKDLTLKVQRGEFFSLLGPSGCGKTTSLRLIGGFEDPTAGRVLLGGEDVTALPPYRRDVNTVFQSYALFPHLDVFENVAFGLRRRKLPDTEIDQRVGSTLELVDLIGLERRRPGQLSGGQQQRVALGRALVNRPRVLLLDEPLGALDLKLRKQMQLELKRIQSEVGITFLYVTHDQEEAMTMSDRIAVMRAGEVLQIGSPEQVYERPATEFVAGFLGASNLLDVRIKERRNNFVELVVEGGSTVTLPSDRLGLRADAFKLGVRPEKIRLGADDAGEGQNQLAGTLRMATFAGIGYQYEVEGPGGKIVTVYEQNVGDRTAARPGDAVTIFWRPEDAFVVSADQDDGTDATKEGGGR